MITRERADKTTILSFPFPKKPAESSGAALNVTGMVYTCPNF